MSRGAWSYEDRARLLQPTEEELDRMIEEVRQDIQDRKAELDALLDHMIDEGGAGE